ncbi:MAG TPA: hypothetical protein VGF55_06440 [Gemmataceae bacterium]|jgi:hypothetical protein
MNGTVVFGVALIAVGLFSGGMWMLPLLVGGVAVCAYGAFAPAGPRRPSARTRLPGDDEPWV